MKQNSVVPWEVVSDQVGQKYSVMDLGQDSLVLYLHNSSLAHRRFFVLT